VRGGGGGGVGGGGGRVGGGGGYHDTLVGSYDGPENIPVNLVPMLGLFQLKFSGPCGSTFSFLY